MKKLYKIPEIETLEIIPCSLLAESDPEVGVNPGTPSDPNDPVLVKGRGGRGGHDVWDDDWSR